MDRRQFLQTGATTLAATAMAQGALAQTAPRPAPAATAAAGPPRKITVDAYSRYLQWIRDPNQLAEAVKEMGFDGIELTVRPHPGHVNPENVRTELPRWVEIMRRNGLRVQQIACPINDADTPGAEAILDACASNGIHHYWGGGWNYDQSKPIQPQLEALKPRVEKLVALNRKYNANFMSHTRTGGGTIGNAIFDLLEVLRNFDPRHVSFHWDSGHSSLAGGNNTWVIGLRAAGPYIGGISFKDQFLERIPAAEMAARPAGGGGGPGGGGPGGGSSYPWRVTYVPLGEGVVNLPLLGQVLREINFSGPCSIQAEYPLGGAERAAEQLTVPRGVVIDALKRDLTVLRTAFQPIGLL